MTTIKIKLHIFRQSFSTLNTFLKESTHLEFDTIEIAPGTQLSFKDFLQNYAQEALHYSGPVSCLPQLIDFDNRWKVLSTNWNAPVSGFVQLNSGQFSRDDTLVMFLNIFNVAPCPQEFLPEFQVVLHVKCHLINPFDHSVRVPIHTIYLSDQQLQEE